MQGWCLRSPTYKDLGSGSSDFEMIYFLELLIMLNTWDISSLSRILRVLYIVLGWLEVLLLFIHSNINSSLQVNSSHISSGFQEPGHAFFRRDVSFISFLENWKLKEPTVSVSAINTSFSHSLRLLDSSGTSSLGSIKHLNFFFFLLSSPNPRCAIVESSLYYESEKNWFVLFIFRTKSQF